MNNYLQFKYVLQPIGDDRTINCCRLAKWHQYQATEESTQSKILAAFPHNTHHFNHRDLPGHACPQLVPVFRVQSGFLWWAFRQTVQTRRMVRFKWSPQWTTNNNLCKSKWHFFRFTKYLIFKEMITRVLPILLLILANSMLLYIVKKSRQHRKITLMTICVATFYIICSVPMCLIILLPKIYWNDPSVLEEPLYLHLAAVCNILELIQCSFRIFIYYFFTTQFRVELKHILSK